MRTTSGPTVATTLEVTLVLTDAQYFWLREAAGKETPLLSTSQTVGRLVDRAIAADRRAATRRASQLEVYAASGYAEHHPDYPGRPADPSDV
jgi:hypothetical protein